MYLKFPGGGIGWALLVIRLQAGAIATSLAVPSGVSHAQADAALVLFILLISCGLFTRTAAIVLLLVLLADHQQLSLSDLAPRLLTCVAIAVGDAGGYSLDAFFFGRRIYRLHGGGARSAHDRALEGPPVVSPGRADEAAP